jgi:hypothetical protein
MPRQPSHRRTALIRSAAVTALLFCLVFPAPSLAGQAQPQAQAQDNDLDKFMAQVLQRRDETWRQLHDYILDEREQFEVRGPGDALMFGQRRQYTWYVRDGYLIRSPLKFNGVALADADRKKYETDWLAGEKGREKRAAERAKKKVEETADEKKDAEKQAAEPEDVAGLEPRFISEAYFMRFKFEPGNYYLVGREQLEQREVLKIEYYPRKRLFEGVDDDDHDRGRDRDRERERRKTNEEKSREDRIADDFERKFNKVALVTLWVDPREHQIVKYTFDNIDFGFLPGRWAVRADAMSASMTMSQPIAGIWLPHDMAIQGAFTLANGGYRIRYSREFSGYKQGEVRAKIRGYDRQER